MMCVKPMLKAKDKHVEDELTPCADYPCATSHFQLLAHSPSPLPKKHI